MVLFTCCLMLQVKLDLLGDSEAEGWFRPGLPPLLMIAGPYQHFKDAILCAWRNKVYGILTARKGFRGGPLLDFDGTKQLLFSSHLCCVCCVCRVVCCVLCVVCVMCVVCVSVILEQPSYLRRRWPKKQRKAKWQGAQHLGLTPGVSATSPRPLCLTQRH